MKKNIVWAVVCLVGLIGLYACSSGGSDPAPLSNVTGTVTLNASVTAKKWFVAIDNDYLGENGLVAFAPGTVTGNAFTYTIQNVPSGTYYLYTVTDIDGSWGEAPAGPVGTGDYIGFFPSWNGEQDIPKGLTVPSTGTVTADMTTIVSPSTNVTGTVTLNTSVADKKWFVAIDNDYVGDNGLVAFATGTVTGNTFTYTIQNVPSGIYYLYTVTDIDGSWGTIPAGPVGTGDYIGFFPSWNGEPTIPKGLTVPSTGTVTADMATIVSP